MTLRMNTLVAATAVSLGLAAAPAFAQSVGADRGFAAARATGQSVQGYEPDGRLNVFGARLDPIQGPDLVGGVANGVTGVVGSTVGVVGSTVGGVMGGTVGAADAITTGSVGPRTANGARRY